MDLVSKTKVINERSEEDIEITIQPNLVKFIPRIPLTYDNGNHDYKPLEVMLAKRGNSNEYLCITNIEGFDYEAGFEYILVVKKTIEPNPYSVKYQLIEMKSKKQVAN